MRVVYFHALRVEIADPNADNFHIVLVGEGVTQGLACKPSFFNGKTWVLKHCCNIKQITASLYHEDVRMTVVSVM